MVAKKAPYKNIAGVTPCPGGWLVLPARLSGITVAAEEAFVLSKLFEVLDFRPTFEAAAINAPDGSVRQSVGPVPPVRSRGARLRRLAADGGDQRHPEPRRDPVVER